MAGSFVAVGFEDRAVRQALKRLQRAGADLQPAWRDIGEYLLNSTRERFDREQAPDGTPWEPLAESTLRRKMLKGVGRGKGKPRKSLTTGRGNTKVGAIRRLASNQILVESGNLRDLMRYQATREGLRFGSDRVYAAIQQFGGADVGRPDIPARPFLGLSAADRAEVLAILNQHLEAALRR